MWSPFFTFKSSLCCFPVYLVHACSLLQFVVLPYKTKLTKPSYVVVFFLLLFFSFGWYLFGDGHRHALVKEPTHKLSSWHDTRKHVKCAIPNNWNVESCLFYNYCSGKTHGNAQENDAILVSAPCLLFFPQWRALRRGRGFTVTVSFSESWLAVIEMVTLRSTSHLASNPSRLRPLESVQQVHWWCWPDQSAKKDLFYLSSDGLFQRCLNDFGRNYTNYHLLNEHNWLPEEFFPPTSTSFQFSQFGRTLSLSLCASLSC